MLHPVQEAQNWALRSEPITKHARARQEKKEVQGDSERETF